MPYSHLFSFSVLTVLALAAHAPAPRWVLIAGLIAYGAMTEGLQSLLPPRTAEWADWFQDVAGILAGVVCYYALACLIKRVYTTNRQNMESAKPADN
jgi:VanZ family protein